MPDTRVDAPPQPTRLSDYRPPEFLADTVDLAFDLDPADTRVAATMRLRRNPEAAAPGAPLRLDGEELDLVALALDGRPLAPGDYRIEPDGALVIPDAPDAFALEVRTRIVPERNTALSGLYVSGGNFCTQCEPEGFRRITYFPDRPDVMARYSVTMRADKTRFPVLLSNGNPVDAGELADGRHWARWVDPHPKPSYLFALVAGDLVAVRDSFTTASGRNVRLAIWVRRGDEDKCGHAMASLKKSMRWDEEVFGLEYDLDVFNIVAVSDFNMGAMENKGLNVFNTRYVLAKPETATDTDYQNIEAVIAHEYFHNWTGNRVTCRDWFQLSLKEGLTVFRDQLFSADQGSPAVCRIGNIRSLRAAQFPEDSGPLAHPVQPDTYLRIDNFYTATVYNKGAEIIRMIHTLLGPEGFRRGMDAYIAGNDNRAATIGDFLAAMREGVQQQGGGIDLGDIELWYRQAGTPEITAEGHYDPESRTYELAVQQRVPPTPGQPEKQPMPIPIAMGLLGPNGDELPTRLDGESKTQTGTRVPDGRLRAPGVPLCRRAGPTGAVAAAQFLGPGQIARRAARPAEVSRRPRYRSGGPLGCRAAGRDPDAARTRGGLPRRCADAAARPRCRRGDAADPGRRGARPGFRRGGPGAAERNESGRRDAGHRRRGDPCGARDRPRRDRRRARRAAQRRIRTACRRGPYRIDGDAIGRRALRNVCLFYLPPATGEAGARLAKAQFDAGANMTDVLAALSVLNDIDCPEREAALDAFYERWADDPLVIDKWFALQARSSLPGTIERVRALTAHPAFTRANPNRVRALVGTFSQANPLHFHDRSGDGYAFLAEEVLALDKPNPTTAARLVQPLGQWRRHDAARQGLMRAALDRILATPGLSPNTYEMVAKSVEAGG